MHYYAGGLGEDDFGQPGQVARKWPKSSPSARSTASPGRPCAAGTSPRSSVSAPGGTCLPLRPATTASTPRASASAAPARGGHGDGSDLGQRWTTVSSSRDAGSTARSTERMRSPAWLGALSGAESWRHRRGALASLLGQAACLVSWPGASGLVMMPSWERRRMAVMTPLPESCGQVARHVFPRVTPTDPGDRRRCAKVPRKLSKSRSANRGWAQIRPKLFDGADGRLKLSDVEIFPHTDRCCSTFAPQNDQLWPTIFRAWPILVKHCYFYELVSAGQISAPVDQQWSICFQLWSRLEANLTNIWPTSANSGRIWAEPWLPGRHSTTVPQLLLFLRTSGGRRDPQG